MNLDHSESNTQPELARLAAFITVVVAFSFVHSAPRARVASRLAIVADTWVGLRASWRRRG